MACESVTGWYNRMEDCCRAESPFTLRSAIKTAPIAVAAYFAPTVFGLISMVWKVAEKQVEAAQDHRYRHLRCHFHQGVCAATFLHTILALTKRNWMGALTHLANSTVSGLLAYGAWQDLQSVPLPVQRAEENNGEGRGGHFPGPGHSLND